MGPEKVLVFSSGSRAQPPGLPGGTFFPCKERSGYQATATFQPDSGFCCCDGGGHHLLSLLHSAKYFSSGYATGAYQGFLLPEPPLHSMVLWEVGGGIFNLVAPRGAVLGGTQGSPGGGSAWVLAPSCASGKAGEMKSGMTRVREEGVTLQEGKASTGLPGSHSFCSSPATVWDWGTLAFRAQLGCE